VLHTETPLRTIPCRILTFSNDACSASSKNTRDVIGVKVVCPQCVQKMGAQSIVQSNVSEIDRVVSCRVGDAARDVSAQS
jgi:hypothetical protein